MLHIYTGREDIDKQRYMFSRIRRLDSDAKNKQKIFLVVPDQFTLETERSAFSYMEVSAFINPVVLSMNRLAGKVLSEAGESSDHIDRYGKYMLLAKLLYNNRDRLELFRNLENSTAFISRLSESIMSLKVHLITPEKLEECLRALEEEKGDALFCKKLKDLSGLYSLYEEAQRDGLPDSTDIGLRFAELIPGSELLKDSCIWISGFDYFSPLQLKVIGRMAVRAAEVNVLLTAEPGNPFFAVTNRMAEELATAAENEGCKASIVSVKKDAGERGIDTGFLAGEEKPPEISHIEKTLFAGPVRPFTPDESHCEKRQRRSNPARALRFVAAGDYYSEAEAAAETVITLVRDEGLRYKDILVICNDQEKRAAAVRRVFSDHGIETFVDKRHEAGNNPLLMYILALTEIVSRGKKAEDVMRWVGTGLTDIIEEDIEDLENHMARYGFRNYRAGESVAASIEYIRNTVSLFSRRFGPPSAGVNKRTDGLITFLTEDVRLNEKALYYADRLEEEGFLEYAAQMRGIWDVALNIFAQIKACIGDVQVSAEEYMTILKVGFASVMMGVLPASSDAVTIGTMQRTRTGSLKAILVLGANDGELPMFGEDSGLFDDIEKETLEKHGVTAFRREDNLHAEEQLAIYKNLTKPSKLLYLSYTAFGPGGKEETKPSRIMDRLRALFPDAPLEKDTDEAERQNRTVPVLSSSIGPDRMRALIPGVLSPTSIENYNRCPFAFLLTKGLKLGAIRKHELDSRGIGDIYHEALKRFGNLMNEEGGAPAEENSAWKKAPRSRTDALVDKALLQLEENAERISDEGALLFEKKDPAAVYRLRRLKTILKDICWAMTENTREAGTERILFEAGFGGNQEFGFLEIGENGLKIAGRIDRIDVLPGGRAKVLDYKSGFESFSDADVKSGWQLQLMLYLKAIEKTYEPGGVSYFRLYEPTVDISGPDAPVTEEEIKEAALGKYLSDGVIVSQGEDIKKTKLGEKVISKEAFDELRAETEKNLKEIADSLARGDTPVRPKQKAGGERITACTWCDYLSICNYEATYIP